jgi:hypothetical protein
MHITRTQAQPSNPELDDFMARLPLRGPPHALHVPLRARPMPCLCRCGPAPCPACAAAGPPHAPLVPLRACPMPCLCRVAHKDNAELLIGAGRSGSCCSPRLLHGFMSPQASLIQMLSAKQTTLQELSAEVTGSLHPPCRLHPPAYQAVPAPALQAEAAAGHRSGPTPPCEPVLQAQKLCDALTADLIAIPGQLGIIKGQAPGAPAGDGSGSQGAGKRRCAGRCWRPPIPLVSRSVVGPASIEA